MSKAEELLNSLIEAYVAESDASSDPHIVIGVDRFVTVPDELKRIAVQYDHNMRTVTFDCPRFYDGRDMSKMKVYINIRGPEGTPYSYIADDVRVDDSNYNVMHFDWTIRRPLTNAKGNLMFLVCIRKADNDGNEENHWNTELNREMYISEGMEYEELEEYPYSDIVTQLLQRMDDVEALANPESMQGYANAWLNENGDAVLAEVQAKGNEVLASIPAEYAETYSYANEAVRAKADAIIRTVEGESIAVSDSSDDYIRGLRVFGKTTQVQTTGAQLFDISKVESGCVVGDDGVTNPNANYFTTEYIEVAAGNSYTFAEDQTYSLTASSVLRCVGYDSNKNFVGLVWQSERKDIKRYSRTAVIPSTVNYIRVSFRVTDENIMINAGDTALPYEPYTGGASSPNPAYPQDLVSAENPTVKIIGANLVPFLKEGSTYQGQGLTLEVYADRCVCSGVPERVYASVANATITLPKGIYTVSGGKMEDGAMYLQVRVVRNGVASHYFGGDSFTIYGDETTIAVTVQVGNTTAEVVNYTFYPILNVGNSIVDYEPYIVRQALVIPHVLLGIPVASGGNYTDAAGQQWICDEVDFERGVHVQRIAHYVFDGSDDEEWSRVIQGFGLTRPYYRIPVLKCAFANGLPLVCSHSKCGLFNGMDPLDRSDACFMQSNENFVIASGKIDAVVSSVDTFRSYIAANPIELAYALETPIETQIPFDLLEVFRQTRTNYSNTTVLNDAGVKMELKYNADTQLYIDNKIAEAIAALTSNA